MTSNDGQHGYAPFDLYPYNPTLIPAYIFLGLFGLTGTLHVVMMVWYRVAFPVPLVIGCAMEGAAYYFRSLSHNDVRRTLPFVIQNLLLLSAPPFLAATIYMSLRRIAQVVKILNCPPVTSRWFTKLFVLVDIACLATQFTGSILSGSDESSQASQGRTVILAGLILQMSAFAIFILCVFAVQLRLRSSSESLLTRPGISHRRYLVAMYVTSCLFLVRNLVRTVEYSQGSHGTIVESEVWLYAFDSCLMLGIVVVLLPMHPAILMNKARKFEIGKNDNSEASSTSTAIDQNHQLALGY